MGRHIWVANSNNIPIGVGTWTCSVRLYKTNGKHDQNMPIDNDDDKEARYDGEDGGHVLMRSQWGMRGCLS